MRHVGSDLKTEKETLQRVQGALFHLRRGLTPFVEARMRLRHGANWLNFASRAAGGSSDAPLDEYGLLKTIVDNWREVFDEAFTKREKHRVRNFASSAFEARNATAHLSLPLRDDEALRYLDAMHNLLIAVDASATEIAEIKKLYDEQRMSGVVVSKVVEPHESASLTSGAAEQATTSHKTLRPWIEVALPHPDVLSNRFKEAEFAADLYAVDSGYIDKTSDYATAKGFFEITFLTEGLKRVLTATLQRLCGIGGDPVIGLQTAFGGGKTHTMLAAYHLASADDLAPLRGISDLCAQAGVTLWKRPRLAVFVGTASGADTSLILKDGPKIHTLWGYLAWRLAGRAGLDLIAEAEAARTNPGSALLVELFQMSGPALILLDELVAYARQLSEDRFEAFLSFIQSLTEAAKMSPGVLIIGSLPESVAEAGGPKGEAALLRLEKVFGRVQSPWLPATGDETYEIIRRRLFQSLDADGERSRDDTVKAFYDLYRRNPGEFPPESREARYQDLLRLSYPIHPELFDRLSKDWASLEKFQRTRGVLRFMANVVGVLWQTQAKDPLIMPARVPISHERVRVSVLYPLDAAFGAVVDKEVDGDGSLPQRIEANPTRRISQSRAATRSARAVFLCSAPLVGQPNAGLTGSGLRLACAEPGDQLAIFGEALRELSERATYLYEESGRYWFSTQPTLNRLAEDRAKAIPDHEIDGDILKVLEQDAKYKGTFHRVFAAPDDPSAIEEAHSLSLVILGPATPHSGKGAMKSAATEATTEALTRCRGSQRTFRNTLIFSAADEALIVTARYAMRKASAWASIVEDRRLQEQLTKAQADDARDKARTSRDGATKAVRLAWSHILYPIKTEGTELGKPFELDQLTIGSKDRAAIPLSTYDKIGPKGDNVAKERLGPETFWLHLEPLWPQDRPHLGVREICDWFASYVYLPKVRDRVVLENAIRDCVSKLNPTFGYAERFDDVSNQYVGLVWAHFVPDFMPDSAVLVRSEAAIEQLKAMRTSDHHPEGGAAHRPDSLSFLLPNDPGGHNASDVVARPQRFYGSVEIDMIRPVKSFDAILDAVVMELQRQPGTTVKLTLDIEAESPLGFDAADIGVVRDNARQLKFRAESTGFS